jgi:hypothetical protein
MKSINWTKEIFKLIFYIGSVVLLFILGKVVFDNTHYSSALIGVSGGFLGILIFQLIRMINFKRNPENYHKERIDFKDERNNMIISSAKSSAYDAEISTFLHHVMTILITQTSVALIKNAIILLKFLS